MKPLTWKREAIGVSEAAWVARHKEGDIEFELYVSDGEHGEPGLCDSSPCDAVWHAWLAVGDDIEQADVWMDETGFGPSNLPEAIVRAEQYLRDEMTSKGSVGLDQALYILGLGPKPDDLAGDELAKCEGCDAPSTCVDADDVPLCAGCASAMRDDEDGEPGTDPEYPISSRGSASEVACEVCDAVDHATEAHAVEGMVAP